MEIVGRSTYLVPGIQFPQTFSLSACLGPCYGRFGKYLWYHSHSGLKNTCHAHRSYVPPLCISIHGYLLDDLIPSSSSHSSIQTSRNLTLSSSTQTQNNLTPTTHQNKPKILTDPSNPPQQPSQPTLKMQLPTKTTLLFVLPFLAQTQAHYMDIVGDWRQRMGLYQLQYSSAMEANARKTVVDSNGQMIHQLNPGSFGQVLAPGGPTEDDFWRVLVGGWLCELPDAPGMNGICAEASKGWAYNGQTGHAELMRTTQLRTIGCAQYKNIWSCDLGYN